MAKQKAKQQQKPAAAQDQGADHSDQELRNGTLRRLTRKTFEQELEKLEIELVKLQEWVKLRLAGRGRI